MEKVYEMLWDCKYCGQLKNLGVTHRHCPACGAPQDATARYFPPDDQKIAVSDHPLVGADRLCGSCGEAQSAASHNCGNCGAPLDGSKAVARRADQVVAEGEHYAGETAAAAHAEFAKGGTPETIAAKSSSSGKYVALGIVGALVVACGLFFFWKKDVQAEVVSLTWERAQAVEQYRRVKSSAWCNELPTGAKELARTNEKRGTEKVEDGQTCKTRKVDQGNGSFTEKEECTPKYKDEPVFADKCQYEALKWEQTRVAKAGGSSADALSDPDANLAKSGDCVGCERLGKRTEIYTAKLQLADGKKDECNLDQAIWSALKVGDGMNVQSRQLTGGVDCGSLKPR